MQNWDIEKDRYTKIKFTLSKLGHNFIDLPSRFSFDSSKDLVDVVDTIDSERLSMNPWVVDLLLILDGFRLTISFRFLKDLINLNDPKTSEMALWKSL